MLFLFRKKKSLDTDALAERAEADISHASNPYLHGREEWLERYGSYIARASQWRRAATALMLICVLSLALNLFQASQATVIPYYVSVDELGRAAVQRMDNPGTPQRALIQAELANIISNWRSVTADMDLQKRMADRLSHFIGGSARGVVQEWYANNSPYERARSGKLVQVAVKGLPLPVSSDSWRVEWTETIRSHGGALLETQTFQATLRVQFMPPSTDVQIMANPGGIYVTEINYSSLLGGVQ